MENEAVRNEVLKFMPRAFVELYEVLVISGLGPGLGVRLVGKRDAGKEPVTAVVGLTRRMTPADIGMWKCSGSDCYLWNPSGESFCADCDRPRGVGAATKLADGVEVREGGIVNVGQAKRARLDTGDGVDGKVTRGPAKGSAHGKREGARRKDVVGEERAIALRARLDRALVRITREVAQDAALAASTGRLSSEVGDAAEDVLSGGALRFRRCDQVGRCNRMLEAHWLFCPYCGGRAVDL